MVTATAISLLFNSCGYSSGDIARIVEERDSLRNAAQTQQRRISRMDEVMTAINSSIDSIAISEGRLFVSGVGETPNSKETALKNVENLAKLISEQKDKIAKLEKQINDQDEEAEQPDENISKLIANYKKQLAAKDREIASLKEQLNQKNVDIDRLRIQVGSQLATIIALDKQNSLKEEALKRQDAMLNQCYMIIADKKTLERNGIVKKGKIVPQGALDRTKFSKVDIRKFTELEFQAKRPRIITAMPASAYNLTTTGNGYYTLRISDPSEFWRISNYLVIQTN